jgi:predicted N-formylglutamate amidohydrolase
MAKRQRMANDDARLPVAVRHSGMVFSGLKTGSPAPMTEPPLLEPDEPGPVSLVNETGASAFFLTCDHGGRAIPRRLRRLGLAEADTLRHIAWDIGIAGVGRLLSRLLDAPLVVQTYSRLVIDCNRDPEVPSSIPEISEATEIPGNRNLTASERAARREAVFRPYHEAISAALDRRRAADRAAVLVALHSFTPVFKGASRPWHAGVLYNRDARLAHPLLALLRGEPGLIVGDNEPYAVGDLSDYTVPVHGERRGLVHVEIEIRQDLIAEPAGQAEWAERLARLLPTAYAMLTSG